jgi:hypothetical protein
MTTHTVSEPESCERYGGYWRLPGHPDVLFAVDAVAEVIAPGATESYWEVTYVGLTDELIALSVCTPDMLAPVAKADRRAKRFDAAGDHFRREHYFVSRAGQPVTRWKLRLYKPRSRAVLLPGAESAIAAAEREAAAERLRVSEQPAGIDVEADDWRYELLGTREALEAAGFGDSFADGWAGRGGFSRAWPRRSGLYSIVVEKPCSTPYSCRGQIRLVEELLQRRSRPPLRLVVNNTRGAP